MVHPLRSTIERYTTLRRSASGKLLGGHEDSRPRDERKLRELRADLHEQEFLEAAREFTASRVITPKEMMTRDVRAFWEKYEDFPQKK